jgi:hypothetical protein
LKQRDFDLVKLLEENKNLMKKVERLRKKESELSYSIKDEVDNIKTDL